MNKISKWCTCNHCKGFMVYEAAHNAARATVLPVLRKLPGVTVLRLSHMAYLNKIARSLYAQNQ